MKNKKKKLFDAVQMVREIRDAMFKKETDPNFNVREFDLIKAKWTKLLNEQELNLTEYKNENDSYQTLAMEDTVKYKASRKSKPRI